MALSFGPHDVEFKDAPLTKVVCQVRFSPIYALLSAGGVAGLQDAIRERYPKTEQKRDAHVRIDQQQVSLQEKVPIWLFSDDRGWTASVAADFVALETASYLNFQEFIDRLDFLLDAVRRTIQPSDSLRVGLRKINAISHPAIAHPKDWVEFIRPELVGLLGAEATGGLVNGGQSETQLLDSDTGTLMIRHGFWNTAEQEDRDLRYHLDLDYYTDRPFEIRGSTDLSNLLQDYSDAITSFFTWSLLPPMYEYLGPRPRASPPLPDGAPA